MAPPTKGPIELTGDTAKPLASQPSVQAPQTSRSNPVIMEIPVRICGSRVVTLASGITEHTGFFSEDTETLIVFPQRGVVRLSSEVAPGDVVTLTNLRTSREVVCRVVHVKSSANAKSCVEIEFTRPVPRFWEIDFPGEALRPSSPALTPASAAPPSVKREPAAPLSPVAAAPPISVRRAPIAAPPASKDTLGERFRSEPIKPAVAPFVPAAIFETQESKQTVESASSALTAAPVSASNLLEGRGTEPKSAPVETANPVSESTPPVATPDAVKPSDEPVLPLTFVELEWEEQPVETDSSAALASPADAGKALDPDLAAGEEFPGVSFPSDAPSSPVGPVAPATVAGPSEKEQVVELASSVGEGIPPVAAPLSFEEFSATLDAALDRQSAEERAARRRRLRQSLMAAVYVSLLVLAAMAGIAYYQRLSRRVPETLVSSAPTATQAPVSAPQDTANSSGTQGRPNADSVARLPAQGPPLASTATASRVPAGVKEPAQTRMPTPASKPGVSTATPRMPASKSPAGKLTLRGAKPPKAAPRENAPPPVVAEVPGGVAADQASSVLGAIIPEVSRGGSLLTPMLPRVQSPAPVVVGGRVQPPRLLSSALPVYPAAAKEAKIEGDIAIQADIDAAGNVVRMKVVSGPVPLRAAAMDALRRWKYEPSRLNDTPVPVQLLVVIKFRLK